MDMAMAMIIFARVLSGALPEDANPEPTTG